jgi:hypothetical protein
MITIKKILLGSSIIKSRNITEALSSYLKDGKTITINNEEKQYIIKENNKVLTMNSESLSNISNECNIVFIFMGKVPIYIRESYVQIRYWTDCPVYLVTDDSESIEFLSDTDIKVVLYKDIKNKSCEVMFEHKDSFGIVNGLLNRECLFFYSMVRFIILEAFMQKYNMKNVFHLEIDNLVFFDPKKYINILFKKPITYLIDRFKRGSGGLFLANSAEGLLEFNNTILDYVINKKGVLQEMLFLGEYQEKHNGDVFVLPCTFDNATELCVGYIINDYYKNFNLFNNELIFDPASIGQILTGEDAFHTKGILRKGFGHNNLGTNIDYSKCVIGWEYNENNLKYPVIRYNGRYAKIANLHVHSKDMLCNMSATLPKPKNRKFITGEQFQQFCEVTMENDDIIKINDTFDNKKLIYTHGHSLKLLLQKIHFFKNKFIIISHNSDINIDDTYLEFLNTENLIALYAQNAICSHEKINILPIGIANSKWEHGNLSILEDVINKNIHFQPNKVHFYFTLDSNIKERKICYENIIKKGIKWDKQRNYDEYLQKMKQCEYIICPVGNGIDTHRFWETIYLGRIPVVINSPFIQKLKPYYKMVILEDWSDFNINSTASLCSAGAIPISMPNKYPKLWMEDYIKEINQLLDKLKF